MANFTEQDFKNLTLEADWKKDPNRNRKAEPYIQTNASGIWEVILVDDGTFLPLIVVPITRGQIVVFLDNLKIVSILTIPESMATMQNLSQDVVMTNFDRVWSHFEQEAHPKFTREDMTFKAFVAWWLSERCPAPCDWARWIKVSDWRHRLIAMERCNK
jgi:hypothetical protein